MPNKLLGHAGVVTKGNYDSGVTYNYNNEVRQDNKMYRSLKENNTAPLTDETAWFMTSEGIGAYTDNNYSNAEKAKVDSAVQPAAENAANGYVGIGADGNINNQEFISVKNRVINVKDFGAKGDGIADDTLSIKNAILSLGTTGKGGVIFIPVGTYIISDSLSVTGNIKIVGQGINNTILKLANNINKPIIQAMDESDKYWIEIVDIGIDGNCANQTSGNTIDLYRVTESYLHRIRITNPTGYGVNITGNQNSLSIANVIEYVEIEGGTNSIAGGICLNPNVTDSVIRNCNIGMFSNGDGILLTGAFATVMENNGSWQNKNGYKLYRADRTRMINNQADYNSQDGYVIQGTNLVQMTACQARESGQSTDNMYDGVYISGISSDIPSKDITIIGLHSLGVKQRNGLNIDAFTQDTTISNCNLNGNHNKISCSADNSVTNISIDSSGYNVDSYYNHDFYNGVANITLSYADISNQFLNFYNASGDVAAYLPAFYNIKFLINSTGHNLTIYMVGQTLNGLVIPYSANPKMIVSKGTQFVSLN